MNLRVLLALCVVALCSTGCNLIGAAAQVLPKPNVAAAYNIKGQTVGVMVWVDRGVALDYPGLRADLAKTVQLHFNEAGKGKNKDLESSQFLDPAKVVQFQEMHPEFEGMPITDVAPRLGVSRVIYIEVTAFETSSSLYLLKGNATGTIQVIECGAGNDKKPRIAFSADLHSTYPPYGGDGVPSNDTNTVRAIYEGTVAQFGGDSAEKFYSHAEDK